MALSLNASPVGIVQQVPSGGTLDGTLPPGTRVDTNFRGTFPAASTGGLFDFGQTQPITVLSIELVLGNQTVWTVYITDGIADAVANDVKVTAGTTETSVLLSESLNCFLLPGQKIRIKTTGTAPAAGWRITVKVASTVTEAGLWV